MLLCSLYTPRGQAASIWPGAEVPALGESGFALEPRARFGWIPPFQLESRDEQSLGLTAAWAPAPQVGVWAHYEGLRATWPDGSALTGSGDVRLGAQARAWAPGGPEGATEIWLGWGVKLPNASDRLETGEQGLGTDETDSRVDLWLRWRPGPASITAGVGLLILGDPLLLASQDDALAASLAAEVPAGPLVAVGRFSGRVWSPRNPADLLIAGGAYWPVPRRPAREGGWQLGAMAGGGLTPAAPDLELSAWLGWSRTCPEATGD